MPWRGFRIGTAGLISAALLMAAVAPVVACGVVLKNPLLLDQPLGWFCSTNKAAW